MNNNILLTDLYQLNMLQAYFNEGMKGVAVFEFFVRKMPEKRQFFVAAGLESVIEYLLNLSFCEHDIEFLSKQKTFSKPFLDSLRHFKFSGDVFALPEGTIFFPDEPILQVIAPISEAQLVESRIINLLHIQTLIASKAARIALQAPKKLLVDFGMRRAHGAEAAMFASRSSYIAGFSGTATVLAGKKYNIPLYGTMAHSYVQAHTSEMTAFEQFAYSSPDNVVLLIDTYDTEQAAIKVIDVAKKLKKQNIKIQAVRLDSGDLGEHALKVRKILDENGFPEINIFCSGDLDEYKISELINYPIDGFGVGTRLDVSNDVPSLDCVYKLQEYAGVPRRKRSEGKTTWPGRKQIYRFYNAANKMAGDTIACKTEQIANGFPLLQQYIKQGKAITTLPSLAEIQAYASSQLTALPEHLKTLVKTEDYPVNISGPLQELAKKVDDDLKVTR